MFITLQCFCSFYRAPAIPSCPVQSEMDRKEEKLNVAMKKCSLLTEEQAKEKEAIVKEAIIIIHQYFKLKEESLKIQRNKLVEKKMTAKLSAIQTASDNLRFLKKQMLADPERAVRGMKITTLHEETRLETVSIEATGREDATDRELSRNNLILTAWTKRWDEDLHERIKLIPKVPKESCS